MTDKDKWSRCLRPWTPVDEVLVGIVRIEDAQAPLYAEEKQFVQNAIESRKKEFVAGRTLARRLIADLGTVCGAISVGENRAPVWPSGVVGSISHTRHVVGVAIGEANRFSAIGFDIEEEGAVSRDMFGTVLQRGEVSLIGHANPEEYATAAFSCKEAVFKAINPISGEFLDFQDVSIEMRGERFTGSCRPGFGSQHLIAQGEGYSAASDGLVKSLFVVRP